MSRDDALAGPILRVFEARAKEGRVEEPGELRRVHRGLRLLSAGERADRRSQGDILSLRVLPGLDGPLDVLVEIDVSGRCGVRPGVEAVALGKESKYLFQAKDFIC